MSQRLHVTSFSTLASFYTPKLKFLIAPEIVTSHCLQNLLLFQTFCLHRCQPSANLTATCAKQNRRHLLAATRACSPQHPCVAQQPTKRQIQASLGYWDAFARGFAGRCAAIAGMTEDHLLESINYSTNQLMNLRGINWSINLQPTNRPTNLPTNLPCSARPPRRPTTLVWSPARFAQSPSHRP